MGSYIVTMSNYVDVVPIYYHDVEVVRYVKRYLFSKWFDHENSFSHN